MTVAWWFQSLVQFLAVNRVYRNMRILLAFSLLLATTLALNLPGVPTEFTANDAVLSAVSGK